MLRECAFGEWVAGDEVDGEGLSRVKKAEPNGASLTIQPGSDQEVLP